MVGMETVKRVRGVTCPDVRAERQCRGPREVGDNLGAAIWLCTGAGGHGGGVGMGWVAGTRKSGKRP